VARLFSRKEEAKEEEKDGDEDKRDGKATPEASASGSSTGSAAARSDALKKRLYASVGLLGVYVTWTIMVRACVRACVRTCVRRVCAPMTCDVAHSGADAAAPPHIATPGLVHFYLRKCVPRARASWVACCC
jgi:hypothetical protein